MTDQPTCAVDTCARPVPDTTFICPTCAGKLRAILERVPDQVTQPGLILLGPGKGVRQATDGGRTVYGIATALDHVIAREVRFTTGGARGSGERPMPYNPAGSEARAVLTSALIVWANAISEQRALKLTDGSLAGLATFLAGQVEWLRAQAAGPEAFGELWAALRQAERATDRPADRRYAGPCTADWPIVPFLDRTEPCGTDLYAQEGHDTATCRTCATEYPLTARREWLLAQAADRLLPVTELARAVDGLGVPVTSNTVKSWVHRKQLLPRGHISGYLGREVAIYRVGDVRALVEAGARRRGALASTG